MISCDKTINNRKIRFIVTYFPGEQHKLWELGMQDIYEWETFIPEIENLIIDTIEDGEYPIIIGDINDKVNEILANEDNHPRQQ